MVGRQKIFVTALRVTNCFVSLITGTCESINNLITKSTTTSKQLITTKTILSPKRQIDQYLEYFVLPKVNVDCGRRVLVDLVNGRVVEPPFLSSPCIM